MSLMSPLDDFGGSKALNSVTKLPSGLDKYPTDPIPTGDGVHNGSVTNKITDFRTRDEQRSSSRFAHEMDEIHVATTTDSAVHSGSPRALRLMEVVIRTHHDHICGCTRIEYLVWMVRWMILNHSRENPRGVMGGLALLLEDEIRR